LEVFARTGGWLRPLGVIARIDWTMETFRVVHGRDARIVGIIIKPIKGSAREGISRSEI